MSKSIKLGDLIEIQMAVQAAMSHPQTAPNIFIRLVDANATLTNELRRLTAGVEIEVTA